MRVRLVTADKGALLKLPKRGTQPLCEKLRELPNPVATDTRHVRQAFLRLFQQYDSPPGIYRSLCVRQACLSLLIELLECSAPQGQPSDSERIRAIVAQTRTKLECDHPRGGRQRAAIRVRDRHAFAPLAKPARWRLSPRRREGARNGQYASSRRTAIEISFTR